jgi:hypothetical protein
MKSKKKSILIVLVLLLVVAAIFGVYYYYSTVITVEGEGQLVEMKIPGETNDLKIAIEDVHQQKVKLKNLLVFKGWIFRQGVKKNEREVYLVLKSASETLVFDIPNDVRSRSDVTNYFKMNTAIQNHGFELSVPLGSLKEKTYQIGFIVSDETGVYYTSYIKDLSLSDGSVALTNPLVPRESNKSSVPLTRTMKPSNHKIKAVVEKVSMSNNIITVDGWGYLEGMNADSMKTYLLAKKKDSVIVFPVLVANRGDVTAYFKDSKLNFDKSGYRAQIAVNSLEKGKYKLGVYIEKGDQTGIIFTEKTIDIGN